MPQRMRQMDGRRLPIAPVLRQHAGPGRKKRCWLDSSTNLSCGMKRPGYQQVKEDDVGSQLPKRYRSGYGDLSL